LILTFLLLSLGKSGLRSNCVNIALNLFFLIKAFRALHETFFEIAWNFLNNVYMCTSFLSDIHFFREAKFLKWHQLTRRNHHHYLSSEISWAMQSKANTIRSNYDLLLRQELTMTSKWVIKLNMACTIILAVDIDFSDCDDETKFLLKIIALATMMLIFLLTCKWYLMTPRATSF
jgi:hypothetical protein